MYILEKNFVLTLRVCVEETPQIGGEEMQKMFGLFLSVALLFTMGFPVSSFSQAIHTTEQPISFKEVESFIQQAYQMRSTVVTNPGSFSLLSELYASSSP